jgi:hypothetical protein
MHDSGCHRPGTKRRVSANPPPQAVHLRLSTSGWCTSTGSAPSLHPTGADSFLFPLYMKMADYNIFREQLAIRFPTYGHALWDPSPRDPGRPVKIGDVGFIRGGKFHCLFNALCPESEQSGVPPGCKQLVPRSSDHVSQSFLNAGNYCSSGVRVVPELPQYSSRSLRLAIKVFCC